jgi:hypothetical protein
MEQPPTTPSTHVTPQSQPDQSRPESLPSSDRKSRPARRGSARCSHRTGHQGRCRLPVQDPAIGLCFRHAALARRFEFDDSEDLSAEILTHHAGDYAAPESINAVLSNVVELVAAGRLSTRRAAVITYALSLMLRSEVILERRTENKDRLPTTRCSVTSLKAKIPPRTVGQSTERR